MHIIRNIKKNTSHMNREQTMEYIFTYYWYHILLTVLAIFLMILLIRHLFFQEPKKEFQCVLVNQEVNYKRDQELLENFSKTSGISGDRLLFDSDYLFSYPGEVLEETKESSYEKFFFHWATGELDAVIMPKSLYDYCIELENEFVDLEQILTEEQKRQLKDQMYFRDGTCDALYVKGTALENYVEDSKENPVLLVFVKEGGHMEANQKFLSFLTMLQEGIL